MHTSDKK